MELSTAVLLIWAAFMLWLARDQFPGRQQSAPPPSLPDFVRLEVRRGDVMVLRVKDRLPPAAVQRLKDAWAGYFKDFEVPLIVLEEGASLTVVGCGSPSPTGGAT